MCCQGRFLALNVYLWAGNSNRLLDFRNTLCLKVCTTAFWYTQKFYLKINKMLKTLVLNPKSFLSFNWGSTKTI